MQKRIAQSTAVLLLLAILLCSGIWALAAGTTVTVSSGSTTAGGTVTLEVRVEGNPGLTNFDLAIGWPEGFALTQVSKEGLACDSGLFAANVEQGLVAWATLDEVKQETATLFRLTFSVGQAVKPGTYTITIAKTENGAFSGDAGKIDAAFAGGTVTVTGKSNGGSGGSGNGGSSNAGGSNNGGTAKVEFFDVAQNSWYYQCIQELAQASVINGYPDGSFRPDDTITCAEALKLSYLAVGKTPAQNDQTQHWAAGYFDLAVKAGVLDAGTDLDAPISRLAIAKVIANAAGLHAGAGEAPFPDCADLAVKAVYDAGIVKGYPDGSFGSSTTITRGEMSMMIWRLYGYVKSGVVPAK